MAPPTHLIELEPGVTPAGVAHALRHMGVPGVGLLESGLDLDGLGRHSYLVARPLVTASAEPGRPLELTWTRPPDPVSR